MAADTALRLERFAANPALAAKLLTSPTMAPGLERIGRAAVASAKRMTPRRTGHLERGIGHAIGIDRRRRALVLRVFGEDFKTGWYEFGTSRTPAVGMLRRGLEDAAPGVKWEGRGR